MASVSPLLRSSFEFLEHGLWHFFRSQTSTDMKFAILHVDQSIELILKEKVRSLGVSIYKNPKETITIWGAYEKLADKKVSIPEKPDLEILHEERNNIQHKFSNPSPEHTIFHIEKAVRFLTRFCKEELNVNLTDFVASSYLRDILENGDAAVKS